MREDNEIKHFDLTRNESSTLIIYLIHQCFEYMMDPTFVEEY